MKIRRMVLAGLLALTPFATDKADPRPQNHPSEQRYHPTVWNGCHPRIISTIAETGQTWCEYATTPYRVKLVCERSSDNYRVYFYSYTFARQGQVVTQDCDNLNAIGYSGTWDIKAAYTAQ